MREDSRTWRVRETLKSRAPESALMAYRRWVSPHLTDAKDHVRFSGWARTGLALREEFGTARVSFEPDGIWITDRAGLEWRYEPDSWMSALGKEIGWSHEPAELVRAISGVESGGAYVDVGAHVGGFVIPVAQSCADVEIHAFEPVPRTRAWLEMNLRRNGLDGRVSVWPYAAGAEARRGTMTGVDGVANHLADRRRAGPGHVDVVIETLDGLLLDRVPRIDVIKCDVEGAELPALRGAESILRRDHPDLILEIDRRFTPRFGYRAAELFAFLAARGYRWEKFIGEDLVAGGEIEVALGETNDFLFTAR